MPNQRLRPSVCRNFNRLYALFHVGNQVAIDNGAAMLKLNDLLVDKEVVETECRVARETERRNFWIQSGWFIVYRVRATANECLR